MSLYSPMRRLSDGSIAMSSSIHRPGRNGSWKRKHYRCQSCFLLSDDEGKSFKRPVVIDRDKFDSNECDFAEIAPGRIVAFMRTLHAPSMWTSTSGDSGRTWSPLKPSGFQAQCPVLVHHSSGVLVLCYRAGGVTVRLSRDAGQTWSRPITLARGGMSDMIELPDGRMCVVFMEGGTMPGRVRAHFFRITPDGPVPAQ